MNKNWSANDRYDVCRLLRRLAWDVHNGRITDGEHLLDTLEDGLPVETEDDEMEVESGE